MPQYNWWLSKSVKECKTWRSKYSWIIISMGQCKKDVTPLLKHWRYVFLTLTHWYGISSTLSKDRERAFIYCPWAFNEIDIDFRQRRGKPVGLVGWFHSIGGQYTWAIGTIISVDSDIILGLVCVYSKSWWLKLSVWLLWLLVNLEAHSWGCILQGNAYWQYLTGMGHIIFSSSQHKPKATA